MKDHLGLQRFRLPKAPPDLRHRVLEELRQRPVSPQPPAQIQRRLRSRLAWALILMAWLGLQVYFTQRQWRLQRRIVYGPARTTPVYVGEVSDRAWYEVRTDPMYLYRLENQ